MFVAGIPYVVRLLFGSDGIPNTDFTDHDTGACKHKTKHIICASGPASLNRLRIVAEEVVEDDECIWGRLQRIEYTTLGSLSIMTGTSKGG